MYVVLLFVLQGFEAFRPYFTSLAQCSMETIHVIEVLCEILLQYIYIFVHRWCELNIIMYNVMAKQMYNKIFK